MDKDTYIVMLQDNASYAIRSSSEEAAIDLALDYFSEREPEVKVYKANDVEPEVEID